MQGGCHSSFVLRIDRQDLFTKSIILYVCSPPTIARRSRLRLLVREDMLLAENGNIKIIFAHLRFVKDYWVDNSKYMEGQVPCLLLDLLRLGED